MQGGKIVNPSPMSIRLPFLHASMVSQYSDRLIPNPFHILLRSLGAEQVSLLQWKIEWSSRSGNPDWRQCSTNNDTFYLPRLIPRMAWRTEIYAICWGYSQFPESRRLRSSMMIGFKESVDDREVVNFAQMLWNKSYFFRLPVKICIRFLKNNYRVAKISSSSKSSTPK